MKEIEIIYKKDGNYEEFDNSNLTFCDENKSTKIIAHFPEELNGAEVKVYISSGNGKASAILNLGSNNPAELVLSREQLYEGKCTVGFEAVLGDTVTRFAPVEFYVSGFIDTSPVDLSETEKLLVSVSKAVTLENTEEAYAKAIGDGSTLELEFGIPKGKQIEMGTDSTSIVWRETDGEWKKLIDFSVLTEMVINNFTEEVALKSTENGGFNGGMNSAADVGGAVGKDSYAGWGFAGGAQAHANGGAAIGAYAFGYDGGAVGLGASTSDGFAGGREAKAIDDNGNGIDAIQLGTGTNSTAKTLKVYSFVLMDENGTIPLERLGAIQGFVVNNYPTIKHLSTNYYTSAYIDSEFATKTYVDEAVKNALSENGEV